MMERSIDLARPAWTPDPQHVKSTLMYRFAALASVRPLRSLANAANRYINVDLTCCGSGVHAGRARSIDRSIIDPKLRWMRWEFDLSTGTPTDVRLVRRLQSLASERGSRVRLDYLPQW